MPSSMTRSVCCVKPAGSVAICEEIPLDSVPFEAPVLATMKCVAGERMAVW
jgi:hypothetical protein